MSADDSQRPPQVSGDLPSALQECLRQFIAVAERLKEGDRQPALPAAPPKALAPLAQALSDLATALEQRQRQQERLCALMASINSGLGLDEVLATVYHDFRDFIPYNRIGCALMDPDGLTVRSRWVMADYPDIKLVNGYAAPLSGSSLATVIATGRPRILNDLAGHLQTNPGSASTRLMLAEGIRASLTCPLIVRGAPVGFLFFSSLTPGIYARVHVETYQWLAQQLSVTVEKGWLLSQLNEQKAAIEEQNRQLRQLNEVRNQFLAMAAHDLRSPLATVILAAQTLLNPRIPLSDGEQRLILEDTLTQAGHMLALIENLLDVAEVQAGRLHLRKEPLRLGGFLSETAHRHALLAGSKGTRVWAEPLPDDPVPADAVRLRQVLDNLISNAVKFSPPGSVVQVRAQKNQTHWRVEVQDEGPGLTEQDRARLFQPFTRLSARPTGGEKSAGLGLAISRRIVEAHGGQLGVDSAPGQGATFWFTLPA